MSSNKIYHITVDKLQHAKPGAILRVGMTKDMKKFVIVRGGATDWAIYIGPMESTEQEIAETGSKVFGETQIRYYSDCSDEALKLYRR